MWQIAPCLSPTASDLVAVFGGSLVSYSNLHPLDRTRVFYSPVLSPSRSHRKTAPFGPERQSAAQMQADSPVWTNGR